MKTFRSLATAQLDPPSPVSTRALAQKVNLTAPVSLAQLIVALQAPVSFHADITTPSGTALGGTADVTVFSDGRYTFDVHMHDSGFDPYDFHVRCALYSPGGLMILFQTSGHTDGTGSSLFGHINRDFNHHEENQNPLIQNSWIDVRESSMVASKSYEDVGALNTLEDIAKDLFGFLVAYVTVGEGLALVISASAELADSLDASFVGTGGLVGVAVAGGVVWVYGPSAIIAAVVAGVAAGAITDALIKHRQMTTEEYQFASTVFGDTLPPRERFFITNLSHGGGRKFTWPNLDGSILLNMDDDAFADPVHYPNKPDQTNGQVFIHELTHAWQIRAKSFLPGILCKSVFQTGSYDYTLEGQAWSDFGLEQQAAIVDHWFGKYALGWLSMDDLTRRLDTKEAKQDLAFRYIANNIRFGQN